MGLIVSLILACALFIGISFNSSGTLGATLNNTNRKVMLSGEVVDRKGDVLYVETKEGIRQVLLTTKTLVFNGSDQIGIDEINTGNKIQLINDDNNSVVHVASNNILPRSQFGLGNWLKRILVLGLSGFLVLILILFMKRRSRPYRREADQPVVGGVEGASLNILENIDRSLQRVSFGIQNILQGGKTSVQP